MECGTQQGWGLMPVRVELILGTVVTGARFSSLLGVFWFLRS